MRTEGSSLTGRGSCWEARPEVEVGVRRAPRGCPCTSPWAAHIPSAGRILPSASPACPPSQSSLFLTPAFAPEDLLLLSKAEALQGPRTVSLRFLPARLALPLLLPKVLSPPQPWTNTSFLLPHPPFVSRLCCTLSSSP